jgi:hypothetical protein
MLLTSTLSLLQKSKFNDLVSLIGGLPSHPRDIDSPYSFPAIARDLDLYDFWSEDLPNKKSMILNLITLTFLKESEKFDKLMYEIVSRSLDRKKIFIEQIKEINQLLLSLGFQNQEICELVYDKSEKKVALNTPCVSKDNINSLYDKLLAIEKLAPHQRGYEFEKFLVDLFHCFSLSPRESFRLIGEQIDSSFTLDEITYLVEAKWQQLKIGNSDLQSFSGKLRTKTIWTRGFYISYSGYSDDGLTAFQKSPTCLICMNGDELRYILEHKCNLVDVLRRKIRHATETGEAFIDIRGQMTATC